MWWAGDDGSKDNDRDEGWGGDKDANRYRDKNESLVKRFFGAECSQIALWSVDDNFKSVVLSRWKRAHSATKNELCIVDSFGALLSMICFCFCFWNLQFAWNGPEDF